MNIILSLCSLPTTDVILAMREAAAQLTSGAAMAMSGNEKIEDVRKPAAVRFVEFGVIAAQTTDRRKLSALYVEHLAPESPRGMYLAYFIPIMSATQAFKAQCL